MCVLTHVSHVVTFYSVLLQLLVQYTTCQVVAVTELPACNATYFRCASSGCLNVSYVCNGEDNCGDNSDEDANYAGCQGTRRLSGGLIAAIAIGSLVGAILLCCWISSVIECIQHMYKYWCSCCHDSDINDITFTTTVIPNPGADPTTIVIAGTLPPSYSSIFRNDGAFMAEASSTSLPTYQNGNMYSPPVSGVGSNAQTPSGPRSLPLMTGNAVISQHCQHCQCQCQRQQQQEQQHLLLQQQQQLQQQQLQQQQLQQQQLQQQQLQQQQIQQQQLQQSQLQQQSHRQTEETQIPPSASLPLPDYPPPRYDPSKDLRWC